MDKQFTTILMSATPIYSAYVYVKERVQKKDTFDDKSTSFSIIGTIVSVAIGVLAAYLSWDCNTKAGVNTGLRILFAFLAFIFGIIYIVLYLIFLQGKCAMVQTKP